MKIISRGERKEDRIYRIECNSCKTLFEFEYQEAKFQRDQRDGDFLKVECPVCKYECSIGVDNHIRKSI